MVKLLKMVKNMLTMIISRCIEIFRNQELFQSSFFRSKISKPLKK